MGEVIEHGDAGNNPLVNVGEENAQVSLKVYQDIYHQVTGRTEQIRKRYSDNLLVEFNEVQQLHHKIMQLCDVHKIIANNESIAVFHSKERKEQFTSFERFKAYNSSTSSPTVNVVLKYNFSIVPAGVERPQEYVVTIRLTSRVAMLTELAAEAPPFIRGRLFGYAAGNTAEITVEYAVYVVARGFLEAFDEWVSGCQSEPNKPVLKFAQRWSHLVPKILQLGAAAGIAFLALETVPEVLASPVDAQLAARFFIIFSAGFFIVTRIVFMAGSMIEDAIDGYSIISYLKLNNGDKRLIESFSKKRRRVFGKFFVGCVVTVALGILSSKLAALI